MFFMQIIKKTGGNMSKLTNVKYNKPSFWEDFFGSNWYNEPYSNGFMRSDVSKRKGNYVFDIDIPGYSKEDILVVGGVICRKYLRWIINLLSQNVDYVENKRVKCERKNLFILRW